MSGRIDGELLAALDRLAPKQRAAVVHHHVGGLPYAQVAELIGSSEAAARRSAADGIARLRELRELRAGTAGDRDDRDDRGRQERPMTHHDADDLTRLHRRLVDAADHEPSRPDLPQRRQPGRRAPARREPRLNRAGRSSGRATARCWHASPWVSADPALRCRTDEAARQLEQLFEDAAATSGCRSTCGWCTGSDGRSWSTCRRSPTGAPSFAAVARAASSERRAGGGQPARATRCRRGAVPQWCAAAAASASTSGAPARPRCCAGVRLTGCERRAGLGWPGGASVEAHVERAGHGRTTGIRMLVAALAAAACCWQGRAATTTGVTTPRARRRRRRTAATTGRRRRPLWRRHDRGRRRRDGVSGARRDRPGRCSSNGMTLYIFTEDSDGASTCYEGCATTWRAITSDEGGSRSARGSTPAS